MTPLRRAALSLLPEGAFLRRDRGDGLYVTDAPARSRKEIDWEGAGFSARLQGKLIVLTPREKWLASFEAWAAERVGENDFIRDLARAGFGGIEAEDMALWIRGLKALESGEGAKEFERAARRRAAVCLREKRGGGSLLCCALIAAMLRENKEGGKMNED